MRRAVCLLAAASLVVAACADDDDGPGPATTTTSAAGGSTTTAAQAPNTTVATAGPGLDPDVIGSVSPEATIGFGPFDTAVADTGTFAWLVGPEELYRVELVTGIYATMPFENVFFSSQLAATGTTVWHVDALTFGGGLTRLDGADPPSQVRVDDDETPDLVALGGGLVWLGVAGDSGSRVVGYDVNTLAVVVDEPLDEEPDALVGTGAGAWYTTPGPDGELALLAADGSKVTGELPETFTELRVGLGKLWSFDATTGELNRHDVATGAIEASGPVVEPVDEDGGLLRGPAIVKVTAAAEALWVVEGDRAGVRAVDPETLEPGELVVTPDGVLAVFAEGDALWVLTGEPFSEDVPTVLHRIR